MYLRFLFVNVVIVTTCHKFWIEKKSSYIIFIEKLLSSDVYLFIYLLINLLLIQYESYSPGINE